MGITEEITFSFQAAQVLLVFVIFLFTIVFTEIQKTINKNIPKRTKDHKNYLKDLKTVERPKSILLIVLLAAVSYLFSPLFFRVISDSTIKVWDFDFLRTSFVLITILIFSVFIWSIKLYMQLNKRIKDVENELPKQESKK